MTKLNCLVGFLLLISFMQIQAENAKPTLQYGPVKKGEALWRIAGKIRPNKIISHQQMMLALLRNNPQAFRLPCNLHTLLPHSILKIPSETDIKQLSIQQATTLFAAQEAEWKLQHWDIVCDKEPLINNNTKTQKEIAISVQIPDIQARNSLIDTPNSYSLPQKNRAELLPTYLPDTQAKMYSMLDQSSIPANALDTPLPFKPLTPDKMAKNSPLHDVQSPPLTDIPLSTLPKKHIDIATNSTQSLSMVLQNILMLLGSEFIYIAHTMVTSPTTLTLAAYPFANTSPSDVKTPFSSACRKA